MNWVIIALAVDFGLRFVILGWPRITAPVRQYKGGTGLYIFPGVLADARNQVSPIWDVLHDYGRLFYGNLSRVLYSPWMIKHRFAKQIAQIDRKFELEQDVLVGISLGATIALDVNDQLFKNDPHRQKPGLIVFDGVAGPENLLSGGNVAGPVFRVLRWVPIGFVSGTVIGAVIALLQYLWINQVPKDAEIEDDILQGGQPVTKEDVKQKAKKDMAGYLFGVFARQMVHISAGKVTPERLSRFAWIQYYEYTWHNVTVSQPAERRKWQEAAHKASVPFDLWQIEAPHVAFAQMPTATKKALAQALPRFLSVETQ